MRRQRCLGGRLVGFENDVHAISVFRSKIVSNIRADLNEGREGLLDDFVDEFTVTAEAARFLSTKKEGTQRTHRVDLITSKSAMQPP